MRLIAKFLTGWSILIIKECLAGVSVEVCARVDATIQTTEEFICCTLQSQKLSSAR